MYRENYESLNLVLYTNFMNVLLKTWWGKVVIVLAGLLLLGGAYIAYALWQLNQIFPDSIAFDANLWRTANTSKQNNPRCLMQRDLKQNHLKLGMTKAEVTALLGEPRDDDQTTSYYLGFCNPFGVDAVALGLEFDSQDKLTRVYDIQY
jgi:hypothetical protein